MTETELILTSLLNCRRVDLYVDRPVLTQDQQARLDTILTRRRSGEPLQYILGRAEFMGLEFKVDPSVLIPRPETELLVEQAIEKAASWTNKAEIRILELGTGSGNIAVSLAKFLPAARVSTVDRSSQALEVAQENAAAHQVRDRVDFIHADFSDNFFAVPALFDIIISNPPYIPSREIACLSPEVQREPRMALDGGKDGLDFYRGIVARFSGMLNLGGYLLLEVGDGQSQLLVNLFKKEEFEIEVMKDYAGTERIVSARYIHKMREKIVHG